MINLNEVHNVFDKWLNMEDERKLRLECMLAVSLTRPIKDIKLWMIVIGASGDGKSEMINAFDDGGLHTKNIREVKRGE